MGVDETGLVGLAAWTWTEPQQLTSGWWEVAVSFKSVWKIKRSTFFV